MTQSLLPENIVALARRVVEENKAAGRKIAVAESCTGGLVAAAITEIPGSSAGQARQTTEMLSTLPDNAVRPLVDALIVQEVSGKIQTRQCTRIEWVVEAIAPIDPGVAGKVIGTVGGLIDPDQVPICARRI